MVDFLPSLQEGDSYEEWRKKLIYWNETTSIEPRRRAFAVRTKLEGNFRKLALALDAGELNTDNGINVLLDKLDSCFRKHGRDDNNSSRNDNHDIRNGNKTNATEENANLSAAEKARLRAQKLTAKLAAEGKCQVQTNVILPPKVSLPSTQPQKQNNIPRQAMVKLPEIKKNDSGGYFAEYDINDEPARVFLTKGSSQELVSRQSGASIKLLGRYFDEEAKRRAAINGYREKPLTLYIQAGVSAKVLVALHKIQEVIRNYNKSGISGNLNNYGLTSNQPNTHHFIQHKLFLGFEQFHPEFNSVKHLIGDDGSNFNFIVQQSGAKVFLRGKGSGFLEANSGRESFEALHIYISHPHQNGLDHARQLCESLIDSVRARYTEFQQNQFTRNNFPPNATPIEQIHPQNMNRPPIEFTHSSFHNPQQMRGNFNAQSHFHATEMHRPPMYAETAVRGRMPFSDPHQGSYNEHPPPDIYHPNLRPYNPVSQHGAPHHHMGRLESHNKYEHDVESSSQNEQNEHNIITHDREHRHRSRSRSPHYRKRPDSRSPEHEFSHEKPLYRKRSRSPERQSSHDRGRSPDMRDRSGHRRSRSREKELKISDSKRKSQRRDFQGISPERKSESMRNEVNNRRKFSEEPKKRRRFSEDPKLLKKSLPIAVKSPPRQVEEYSSSKSRKPLKTKETPIDDKFLKPSSKLKPTSSGFKMPAPVGAPSNKLKKNDVFKAPPPLSTIPKEKPKALKIGALGSLAVYDDDSDED